MAIRKYRKTASLKININNKRLFWEKKHRAIKVNWKVISASCSNIYIKEVFNIHYNRGKARTK